MPDKPPRDYGIGAELHAVRRAAEARREGNKIGAKHHDMMAKLAANKAGSLIRKITDTFLRTEVWVANSIPHTKFEQAFKKFFPQGKITGWVNMPIPARHKDWGNGEEETFKRREK